MHLLACSPFMLFGPTFKARVSSEQPTKLSTPWSSCRFSTICTHLCSFLNCSGFTISDSLTIQNYSFGFPFEAVSSLSQSYQCLRHGQMMGIQKWQLNWAPNLESGYVTGTIGIAEWMNWMILNWTSQIGAILIYSFVFPNARSSVNLDLKIYIYSCFTFSGSLSASFWTI